MSMKVGIIGLGRMGEGMSRRMIKADIEVWGYRNTYEKACEQYEAGYVSGVTTSLESLVQAVKSDGKKFTSAGEIPGIFQLVIPAELVEETINELLPLLSDGDIIIDHGNSNFKDSRRRAERLAKLGIQYIDCGTSGGVYGLDRGFCLMVGGTTGAVSVCAPIFRALAPGITAATRTDPRTRATSAEYGWLHCGSPGAGHFVKMVHNGIEYAEMQLLAEIFELDLSSPNSNLETLQKQFSDWNNTESKSYLLEITAEILSYKEKVAPFIDLILEQASNKGTGAWATSSGAATGFPNTLMAAALHARYTSSFKSERIRHAKQLKFPSSDPPKEIPDLKKSYDLSRWINHHQGFEMIRHTGNNFGWELNLSDVAQLWTEGCIIKSDLMNQLCILFKKHSSIFEMDVFQNLALKSKPGWAAVLQYALTTNIPIPCLSSSWNYLLSMTQEQSNARLIQAQRDFFGAHGFKRVDQEEQSLNHGPWHDNS